MTTLEKQSHLDVTVDGADEFDGNFQLIKGGGGALLVEKIVATSSRYMVVIADQSKKVNALGKFPLPVEVIPMAARRIARQFAAMGSLGQLRMKDGAPLVTDNGQHILDVTGLQIEDPRAFELQVSQWPGVVTVGVFALQKADVCLLGTGAGVKTLVF
jgi:ribose 5-phosphate isomerase A